MSGGYFDYNQYKLQNIAGDLWNLLDEPEKFSEIEDKESFIKEVTKLFVVIRLY